MLSVFFQGLLLGIGAAVPLGPINILIMNRALVSYRLAVMTGLGALSADLSYITLLIFGFATFLKDSLILNILGILGGIFLIYMAYLLYAKRDDISIGARDTISKGRVLKAYTSGYLLTLLNPYTIAFWASTTTLVAKMSDKGLWMALGIIISIVLWITIMPYVIHRSKHRLSESFYSNVSTVAAFILCGFGVYLLYVTCLE
jgi:L-lysine exporter family protein LysE/ArgO